LAAKLLAVMLPLTEMLRNTETVLTSVFTTSRSGLPTHPDHRWLLNEIRNLWQNPLWAKYHLL
jgi:hypothetical protein